MLRSTKPAGTLDTTPIEAFFKVEIDDERVRVMAGDGARSLLLMWDMTHEQFGTLRAIMDGRWDEYRQRGNAKDG